MRYSKYFIPTYKETPSDAEVMSHQFMLRAGMIRKLTSGIYTYLPTGLRSIKKVENIVREEMDRYGAIELLMPAVQPAELWRESGRWEYYGTELLRFKDRHERDACFGPTHEEVITDLVRREIRSYKQMPINFYQIQTKFRDEIRPRFGLMRGREFIMKDGYSFDIDDQGANHSYELMYEAYCRIFQRCGLTFRAVEADTGAIGGTHSHEFMVLAETGEDQMVHCNRCKYAANLEKAEVGYSEHSRESDAAESLPVEKIHTPDVKTIEALTSFLGIPAERIVKTLLFVANGELVAVLLRGDHELNETKLKSLLDTQELELAGADLVKDATGAPMGFAGPIGLKAKLYADQGLKFMSNFVTGANEKDMHLKNVNLYRDFTVDQFADLRVITPQDLCPRCGAAIHFGRGIEVGHIFKLGTKYSRAMKANFLDQQGREWPIIMGCYGIGIGRTVAAAIEQNHDERGIIFPIPIAPFEITILPLQMYDSEVVESAEKIYNELRAGGIDVILDDRDERAGVKFNDADLLGIPLRLTVGKRGLEKGNVEVKLRKESESREVPLNKSTAFLIDQVKTLYDSLK